MERRHVLEPHLERRARELLAENIEQVLPRIQLLFFHALAPFALAQDEPSRVGSLPVSVWVLQTYTVNQPSRLFDGIPAHVQPIYARFM